jgi:hypothetical protein
VSKKENEYAQALNEVKLRFDDEADQSFQKTPSIRMQPFPMPQTGLNQSSINKANSFFKNLKGHFQDQAKTISPRISL